ncbi:phage structural protein [Paraburkholderia dioscoreae]|jgi:hypothetical protein|uniref:Bacteriophage protein n=1 Tax=Paraburkholderia dioscoreae TaxID=2604047 RepID=A0A5Q4ZB07_9BURK|nr:phage protein [Paraburkholderia dioscoreae]VVD29159.1 conserved protein of unknown function [Paraburkholderia dioscoreae]
MSTYSFLDVSASITGPGGAFALGYGEAVAKEGIKIAMAGDKNTMTIGADGEGMHSLHADKSGQVTLRYLKTAPINAKLMALYDAQTISSSLHGQNVITVRNTASGDITTARKCAFKKKPDLTYAEDGDIVEWVFDSIKIDTLLGTYSGT